MKEIQLVNGKGVALVDDDDFERLSSVKWYLSPNGYAISIKSMYVDGKKTSRSVLMHRLVLECGRGCEIDHINHSKLDNQKSNLRAVTHGVNQTNRFVLSNASSGYRGVYAIKASGKQPAEPRWKGEYRMRYLGDGYGESGKKELAYRYDLAALRDQGGHAQLNFPITGLKKFWTELTQRQVSDGGGVSLES